jgi:hypothetical protein
VDRLDGKYPFRGSAMVFSIPGPVRAVMTLRGDLETTIEDGGVRFEFEIGNDGTDPEELTFRDAGKADFLVEREGENGSGGKHGRGVHWRYGEGRVFAQVIETERLEPNESTTYECRWESPDPGEYVARATLRAQECDLEAERELSIEE